MTNPASPSPIASGALEQYPLPSLLFYLYKKRFNGILSVGGDAMGRIYFRDGMPVYADHSSVPYESLARALLELGLLGDSLYERVLSHMATSGVSEEDALRTVGSTSEENLAAGHRHILRHKLNLFFKAVSAPFALYSEEHPHARDPNEAEARRVHPRRVIYHGIRNAYDEDRVSRELGDALSGKIFRIASDRFANLERYGFVEDERPVVDLLCTAPWTLDDLSSALNRGEVELRMLVYALLSTEMLEVRDRPSGHAQPRVDLPVQPPPVTHPPPRAPAVTPTRFAKVLAESRPPGATPLPQTKAPEAKSTAAAAKVGPHSSAAPAAGQAAPSKGAALRTQIEAKMKTIAKENLFEVLGVTAKATKADVKKAYIEAAKTFHPDRLVQFGLEELRSEVEQIFARINEANATLSDDTKRAEYAEDMEGREMPSPEAEAELRKALSAELEFQKGEMLIRQRQFAKAEEHLKRAVDANPDIEHQVSLAWARYNNPQNNRDQISQSVKEVLTKAAKERSSLARVHLYIGEIFLNEDQIGTAEKAFERAVQLAPENVDAQRGLRLAQARRSKGGDKPAPFGGLFSKKKK